MQGLKVKQEGQQQNGKESHGLLGNFSIDCAYIKQWVNW